MAKPSKSAARTPSPPDSSRALLQRIAAARAAAFTNEDPAAAFAHFRPLAERVPTEGLQRFTGQPLLMRTNVVTALKAMEPHLHVAMSKLVDAPLQELFELPALVYALDFAVGRVPVAKVSAGDIAKMLKEGSPWRELTLTYLEVVSHPLLALVPQERVRAVREGSGKLDQAQDFVAIAGLFAEFAAAIAGKHPFPPEHLARLATLGGALVQQLQPGNTVTEVPQRSPEAVLRDQLAAMVADRYDQLEVLAAVAVGKRKADTLLPALRSAASASMAAVVAATPETVSEKK